MSDVVGSGKAIRVGASVAGAAGVIAVITLVARAVGFGRWFAFSHAVGATCVGTVYQSTNAVPNVLFEIAAGGVLAAVAVPLVATAIARGRRADADAIASGLLGWSLLVLVPLAGVVALAAEPIAQLLVGTGPGCEGAVTLGTDLLRMFAVQIPLYGVAIVLAGVLQAHRRFIAAALAPLLSSLVVIVAYLGYRTLVGDPARPVAEVPQSAVLLLGLGTTAGVVVLSLPLLVPARRAGIRLRPSVRFPDGIARRVAQLAVAGLLAVGGQQLATLIVIRLANDRGGAGTLNAYTYTQAITLLPYAILVVPLATAAFPALAARGDRAPQPHAHAAEAAGGPWTTTVRADGSETAADQDPARTLSATWVATIVAGLFSASLLVAAAKPVGALFAHLDAARDESSGSAALGAMSEAIALAAPGVVSLSVIALLSRATYVTGRARVAGTAVAAGWLLTAVAPTMVLAAQAGPAETLRWLATGTSIGLSFAAVALVLLVTRAWGGDVLRISPRTLTAVTLAALVTAGAGWVLGSAWSPLSIGSALLACAATGLLGVTLFGAVLGVLDRATVVSVARRLSPRSVEESSS